MEWMKGRKMKRALRAILLLAAVASLTLPLGACGKKGDLLPPPDHSQPAEDPDGS